jgi:hypothetical protein
VRSAGAVPSAIAAMMRGERKARGTSSRMCRSPTDSPRRRRQYGHPGLGNGGKQSVPALGFHRWLCARLMNDALHGHESWRRPGKGDHGRRTKFGNGISEAGVFGLRRISLRATNFFREPLRLTQPQDWRRRPIRQRQKWEPFSTRTRDKIRTS